MTFQTETEAHTGEPLVLCIIELDNGDQHIAKVDTAESSNFYDGRVKSFGSVSRTVASTNSAFKTSDVTIVCFNTDQHFSRNWNYKKLLNRTVSIKVGTVNLAIGDFKQIYKGVITNFSYSSETFKLAVRDATERHFNSKDYATIISIDDFSNCDDSAIGKRMPIIYGECTGSGPCRGEFIDTSNYVYLFAGHASKAIDNVYRRDTDGELTEIVSGLTKATSNAYINETIDNAAAVDKGSGLVGVPITGHGFTAGQLVCFGGTTNYDATYVLQGTTTDEVVIFATYAAETFGGTETAKWYITTVDFTSDYSDYDIVANIDGVEATGDDSGSLITNPITQMEHFVDTWLSLPSTLKDTTGITAAETIAGNRSYAGAGIIKGTESAKKILQNMALCCNALIFHNTDGEFSAEIFDIVDFITNSITPTSYTDQDHIIEKSFKIKPQLRSLCNKVIANYEWDEGLGEYKSQKVYTATAAVTAANKTYEKVLNLSFINSDTMAADVAQRFLKQYKYPPMECTFKTSLTGLNEDLVSMIGITHFAGTDTGGYDGKLHRIEKIKPDLNRLTVTVSAIDASTMVTNAFILGDETAIGNSWTDGDADSDYGYLCSEITEQFSDSEEGKRLY